MNCKTCTMYAKAENGADWCIELVKPCIKAIPECKQKGLYTKVKK